jgi:hypothetical protein
LFGFGAKEIGRVSIPGEETITLPAGKVKVRYEEDREGRAVSNDGGRRWAGPQESLDVSIVPAGGGEPLSIRQPRMISEGAGRGVIRGTREHRA